MHRLLWLAGAALAAWALAQPPKLADAARGKDLFERRCTGCHALDRDKEGPRLGGVYGRISGTVKSFTYSDALRNARVTWGAQTLNRWLTDPEKLVPGNDMTFRVDRADERIAIISYLAGVK